MGELSDGPQPKETEVDRLAREVNAEVTKWVELGIGHPQQVFRVDQLHLAASVDAMQAALIEAGVLTQEDLEIRRFSIMLERLKTIREQMTPQIEEQRRESLIVRQMPNDGHLPFERN